MEITYQYMKKRRNFGRQPLFCEQGPEICDSIVTNKAEFKNYILRNPVHEAIQNTPVYSRHEINTIRAEYTTSGVNHAEGGWPKDINSNDPEATDRYRRREQKDDDYIHCVNALAEGMEHYIMQNNAIDMYRTYFAEMAARPALEKFTVRTINEYRDPFKRPVSGICWTESGHNFAVTYVDIDFYREPRQPVTAFIWDIENANSPQAAVEPSSPMFDLQYNHRDENLLAGAMASGQVALWDIRQGRHATTECPPHVAHRDAARKVIFLTSKSGMEVFSGGNDGCLKWWDLRNMSEPTDVMIIDVVQSSFEEQSMARATGVSVLEYEATIPTRFMVGTENGLVVGGNRKGKTPMEKLPMKFEAHLGPVWSLQRNPMFLKNFLTVGDWTARVWSEDCRESPIIWSNPMRHRVTAGEWSPARLSLLLLVTQAGRVTLWDLLRDQDRPVVTLQLTDQPLSAVRYHDRGSLVAVGSSAGLTFMVELSPDLCDSGKNDKQLMNSVFERESKRERILEARLREIKLKQRQEAESSPAASLTDVDAAAGDRDLADAAADYFALIRKEQALF